MSKDLKILGCILGCIVVPVAFVLISGFAGCLYIESVSYHNAIEDTKKGASLNDFPASATINDAGYTGYYKQATVRFEAPLEDIDFWIKQSPGTKNITPTKRNFVRKYIIVPSGVNRAELEVDEKAHTVHVFVCW